MTLRLSIENVGRLPDGRPPRIEVKDRGLDFGRDTHLDWTLPDGSRLVSGKHCEIRFKEGGYWLRDVSTNGTFVNGSPHRLYHLCVYSSE
jgi:type VI secretion system protein ImpI